MDVRRHKLAAALAVLGLVFAAGLPGALCLLDVPATPHGCCASDAGLRPSGDDCCARQEARSTAIGYASPLPAPADSAAQRPSVDAVAASASVAVPPLRLCPALVLRI